jgi:hypothetical protein
MVTVRTSHKRDAGSSGSRKAETWKGAYIMQMTPTGLQITRTKGVSAWCNIEIKLYVSYALPDLT